MRDRILPTLAVLLIILAGTLLLLSGLNHFFAIDRFPISTIREYIGFSLLGITFLLLIFNVFLTRHPLYEYWIVILIGFTMGLIYSF